ncbi:MAG: ABC transporter permease [Alphaproteobacteria bacterium]
MNETPKWVSLALVPIVQLLLAFIVAGFVIWAIGENPFEAGSIIWVGAFGSSTGIGYTLFYATSLVFTGLAMAVAFHAGLFNIGGEGQAYLGGLGIALVCVWFDPYLPTVLIIPLAILGAAIAGAAWAFIPALLQAMNRGHVVITTIMFNFIAASLMQYMLVGPLKPASRMEPTTRFFAETTWIPQIKDVMGWFDVATRKSPLNMTLLLAVLACVFVYFLIWRTRWGYAIRTTGANATAAIYGGIKPKKVTIIAMLISGGLAGLMAVNVIMGAEHRVQADFVAGIGFTGIAVALVGRNHPFGIILAAVLFGALTQGGTELLFEMSTMTPEIVIFFQGLVVLFTGALEYMVRPFVERTYLRVFAKQSRLEGAS